MQHVSEFRTFKTKITTGPIIYQWWFKADVLDVLLNELKAEVEFGKIIFKDNYALLYIGSGINGNDRLVDYHILDKNNYHESGIKNKRLSSLRQTLCGLLKVKMSSSKKLINDFIDSNCKIDWEVYNEIKNKKQLEEIEKKIIRESYLPLNWQNTSGILTTEHRKILTLLKKKVRE